MAPASYHSGPDRRQAPRVKRRQQDSSDKVKVALGTCKYEILRDVVGILGFEAVEVPDETEMKEDWDLCWMDTSVTVERVQRLKGYQRLNHFPGMLEICRKVALAKNMDRMARYLPEHYDFFPQSWSIPRQLDQFIGALRRRGNSPRGPTYIVKPSSGAMGKGIHLVQTEPDLMSQEMTDSIAQTYIKNPLLIDGYKFDLRIYVLVRSVDPLEVHVYKEGLARLATEPYEAPGGTNLHMRNMHLTNYAVNKLSGNFDNNSAGDAGSKRLLSTVLENLHLQGKDTQKLWRDIEMSIAKTVIAIQPHLAHTYHTSARKASKEAACGSTNSLCFELLGFDVLVDEDLHPWVLEVNHSPSFTCDSRVDLDLKLAVIKETIGSLGLSTYHRNSWHDLERQRLSERLYAPASRGNGSDTRWRRPGSVMSKRERLRAAAAALDAEDLSDGKATMDESIQHYRTWGFSPSKPAPQIDMGRFQQIYPHNDPEAQEELEKILQVSSCIYPPQGCVCNFCKRQQQENRENRLSVTAAVEMLRTNSRRGNSSSSGGTGSSLTRSESDSSLQGSDEVEVDGEVSLPRSASSFSNESSPEPAGAPAHHQPYLHPFQEHQDPAETLEVHRFSLATLGRRNNNRNTASASNAISSPRGIHRPNAATSTGSYAASGRSAVGASDSSKDRSFEKLTQHFQEYERRRSARGDANRNHGLKSTNLAKEAIKYSIDALSSSDKSRDTVHSRRLGRSASADPERSPRGSRPEQMKGSIRQSAASASSDARRQLSGGTPYANQYRSLANGSAAATGARRNSCRHPAKYY